MLRTLSGRCSVSPKHETLKMHAHTQFVLLGTNTTRDNPCCSVFPEHRAHTAHTPLQSVLLDTEPKWDNTPALSSPNKAGSPKHKTTKVHTGQFCLFCLPRKIKLKGCIHLCKLSSLMRSLNGTTDPFSLRTAESPKRLYTSAVIHPPALWSQSQIRWRCIHLRNQSSLVRIHLPKIWLPLLAWRMDLCGSTTPPSDSTWHRRHRNRRKKE